MTSPRTLLLMRHARAQDFAPGLSDEERPLTDAGVAQAGEVGDFLRGLELSVDAVLCSTAVRTRQTLEAMRLDAPVEFSGEIYNAGSDAIARAVSDTFTADVTVGLVIGHAPGIPALVHSLADPANSDLQSLQQVEHRFPTGTIVRLAVDQDWAELSAAGLRDVRLGH